ncbi:MAG: hypothetical protein IAE79_12140 [Anaerolinea sp.]|nr:hypothetical protein [Anaerolinea sp.]
MSQASYKRSRVRPKNKKKQTNFLNRNWIALLLILVVLAVGVAFVANRSSDATRTVNAENAPAASSNSENPYAGILGPNDWTEETEVQIYNRRNGQWEDAVFGDVGNDMEFIVGDYVYATTEQGYFFLKSEIDISKLGEADRPFDPDNWRVPEADDVVFLFKSVDGSQQKGHWLFTYVKPGSEIVFQGKVWRLEYDIANDEIGVVDTGNVFARVTQTHVNFHEDDVLALTVKFDSCGKTDIITGSEEHPFYVLDVEDYIPMVDLQPDMRLKTDNGSLATVVELKPLDESMELYNLTVEHVHNYYIYTSEDATGVLVHNTGPCDGFTYSSSVQRKMANTNDIYHNFPSSLDADIMSGNPLMVRPDGRQEFIQQGVVNNTQGVYHITLGSDGQTIIHRTFVPQSAWDNFANNHGLPSWSNLP